MVIEMPSSTVRIMEHVSFTCTFFLSTMRRPGAIWHERGVPSSQSRQVSSIHGADMAMKTDPRPRSIGSGACEINARFTVSSSPPF